MVEFQLSSRKICGAPGIFPVTLESHQADSCLRIPGQPAFAQAFDVLQGGAIAYAQSLDLWRRAPQCRDSSPRRAEGWNCRSTWETRRKARTAAAGLLRRLQLSFSSAGALFALRVSLTGADRPQQMLSRHSSCFHLPCNQHKAARRLKGRATAPLGAPHPRLRELTHRGRRKELPAHPGCPRNTLLNGVGNPGSRRIR